MSNPLDDTRDGGGLASRSWAPDETVPTLAWQGEGLEGADEGVEPNAEPAPGAQIGRYVVLSKLGSGAMGVVLAAYDPDLDRKVAIKLLKSRGVDQQVARGRLQHEAQVLAKLNHPNVVAVHDVGVHEGQVFVAMEFVDGQTVADWNGGHGHAHHWRKVVEVFEAAGRGLAAAHARSLVHRDFKPENVMIGTDGRVRVMDFGLAYAKQEAIVNSAGSQQESRTGASPKPGLTQAGFVVGTPAYMAPEQYLGADVNAKSDQFGFCVSLFEALFGVRPFLGESHTALAVAITGGEISEPLRIDSVPQWLRRLVFQGLSVRPEDRYSDMAALLVALASGEARRRRNRMFVAAGFVVACGASSLAYQDWELGQRRQACQTSANSISEIWNETSRAALRTGILATGVGNAVAVADKVMPWIDLQVEAWRAATLRACSSATVNEILPDDAYDKVKWCLEERRLELSTLILELSEADPSAVQQAVRAAAGLESLATCVDPLSVSRMLAPPPEEVRVHIAHVRGLLSRVRYLAAAAEYQEGLKLAQKAKAQAETLDWPPVLTATLVLEAILLRRTAKYEDAERVGIKAYRMAADQGDWALAAQMATELSYCVGYKQARHAEGKLWAEHAEVARKYAGDPGGLREAARLNNLATIYYSHGEYAEAVPRHLEALATREKTLGANHPDVAMSLNNLANALHSQGELEESAQFHIRALAIREATLGAEHPDVGTSLNNFANLRYTQGMYEESAHLHLRALSIREEARGPEHPDVATSLNNLGEVRRRQERYEEAENFLRRALKIRSATLGAEHPRTGGTMSNLARVLSEREQFVEASELHRGAIAVREKRFGSDHPKVAESRAKFADTLLRQGRAAQALETYQSAMAIWEHHGGLDQPDTAPSWAGMGAAYWALGDSVHAVEHLEHALAIRVSADRGPQNLADSRMALARALWSAPKHAGGDPPRALELARQAQGGYLEAGSSVEASLREAEAWLDERH